MFCKILFTLIYLFFKGNTKFNAWSCIFNPPTLLIIIFVSFKKIMDLQSSSANLVQTFKVGRLTQEMRKEKETSIYIWASLGFQRFWDVLHKLHGRPKDGTLWSPNSYGCLSIINSCVSPQLASTSSSIIKRKPQTYNPMGPRPYYIYTVHSHIWCISLLLDGCQLLHLPLHI